MTEGVFLESVGELLTNSNLYDHARQMQQIINSENGLEIVINEIEKAKVGERSVT